ncbi:MAG: biotin--[acetyl-CoA-carboxylase] ligase, partial [Bryobacteraceae bacterium]
RAHSRERLLVELVRAAESFTRMLVETGPQPVLAMFRRVSSFARGKRVCVVNEGGVFQGVTDDLDPRGFLWLRTDDGNRVLLRSGGVRPLE